jgi:hypothetical protein
VLLGFSNEYLKCRVIITIYLVYNWSGERHFLDPLCQ